MLHVIVITSLLTYFFHKKYRSYNDRKYEIRLFRLRDKLRDAAAEGKVTKEDWTFYYLDTSITKMTKNLKSINIFYAMYLRNKHYNDKEIKDFKRHLEFQMQKSPEFKSIYKEYQELLSRYMISKHVVLLSFAAVAVYGYLQSIVRLNKWRPKTADSIEKLTLVPETSTSIDFIRNRSHIKFAPAYC